MDEEKPRYVMTDKTGWIRDTHTGAILSVDQRGQKDYHDRMKKFKETQSKINTLEKDLRDLQELVKKLMDNKE